MENCYRLRLPRELSLLSALQRLGVNHQRLEEVGEAVMGVILHYSINSAVLFSSPILLPIN